MKMSKRVLTSAMAMVLAGGMGTASAVVDLDAGTGAIIFASEATVSASGTAVNPHAAGADVTAEIGFSISAGTSKYVRINLSAPLGANLATGDFAVATAAVGDTPTVAISAGGTAGDSYVIVEITSDADILQDDTLTFQPQTGDEIEVIDQSAYSITFTTYEFAADAINQTNPLNTATGTWFTWSTGLALSCTNEISDRIDVTDPTTFLTGLGPNDVFSLSLNHVTGVYTLAGVQVDIETDYFTPGTVITITGDMTAFGAPGDATLPGEDGNPGSVTIAADEQSASVTTVADGAAVADTFALPMTGATAVFAVTADGTNDIPAGSYSVSMVDDGGATFDVGTKDLGTCGTLLYSGSTDRVDFALTPSGVYTQLFRVTNPSNTAGDVTFTVYNDAGDSASFNLGDIAGVASSTLAARASTGLINLNDVYAAAQAADATFSANGGKLRVQVRGEFGDDALDSASETVVGRRDDGIYIQALTLSLDGNAFFQTK